eukprot:TRINITY_DN9223_c0_g2_i2.p1 TRINITY_DN9223_c0_g2~~TRINITY_DN9223_c0_g2_i2.p1  ORF type:complete len:121 (+),score=19.92 TRINITY_DN9223_c0_g2_i2:123-485(+)
MVETDNSIITQVTPDDANHIQLAPEPVKENKVDSPSQVNSFSRFCKSLLCCTIRSPVVEDEPPLPLADPVPNAMKNSNQPVVALLPPLDVINGVMNRKCVVIDLDETLVHSSFRVCLNLF